jgi:DNA-binding CsgD family transcriptional regulator
MSTLAAAREGRGGVVVIEAPAGFGKSKLLWEIRVRAEAAGMDVLAAAGRWDEREFGFAGAVGLFESRLDAEEPAQRERFLSQVAGEAVPVFTPGERDIEPTFDTLHGLYRLCGWLARERPLAILVDDVDLMDGPTLRFLVYLAERLDELPVALVATQGSVPDRFVPDAVRDLASVPAAQRFELAALTVGQTARRIRSVWPAAPIDACGIVHEHGGGTAHLVDLLAAERFGDADDATPAIAAWVLRRASRLHESAPELLRAIAVLGPGCELRHAATLAGVDAASAAGAVGVLTEAGMLEPEERLSFTQPVVANAIEAAQLPGDRAAAHLVAARMMAEDQQSPEAASQHLLKASSTGSAWAVDCLCEAATLALGRGAPGEAVKYLRRALAEPPMGRQRAHVALELGRAEAMAGEPHAATRLSEAAEWASAVPERPTQALATGRALFALGQPEQAMSVFDQALADGANADPAVAGQLRAGRAAAEWLTQLPDGGVVRSGTAPETADTPGDRALLALHAMEGAIRGTPCVEVRDLAARALARGALLEDETADGPTYYLSAAALALAEDLQTAEAALTAALEDARTRGSVLGFATASHVRAMAILMRGRIPDAAADARAALGAEPEGWRLGLGGARLVLALTALETGDIAEAEHQLDDADVVTGDAQPLRVSLLMARGHVRMARGEAGSALIEFRAAGEMADRAGVVNPAIAPWRTSAARAMDALGDSTEAIELAEAELALAESFGAPAPIGRALRVIAGLRDARGQLDLLHSAVEVLEGSQAALERARAFVDLGAALRRSGRLRDARPHLRAGLELAERCGATMLAARASQETKASGARPRRTALSGPESLTGREREVSELAAHGRSNREIAAELFVTIKTVEYHLKHAYQKLGVGSRQDLRQFFPDEG